MNEKRFDWDKIVENLLGILCCLILIMGIVFVIITTIQLVLI